MATPMVDVKQVAEVPRSYGCSMLAQYLQWEPSSLSEEDNPRQCILLDFLYDNLMFAVNHGFPWSEVCSVLNLAKEIQEQTVGSPLVYAISLYRQKAAEYVQKGLISGKNLKLFTSHFFDTFMRHYRLYQIVFTQPRSPLVTQLEVDVEIPPETFNLSESKPKHIWEYNQKIDFIESEERQRIEAIQAEKQELLKQVPDCDKPLGTLERGGVPLKAETISEAIHETTSLRSSYEERILQTQLEETHEGMDYYLEKTALPRPAALGPPPRTKSSPRPSVRSKSTSTKSGGPSGKNSLGGDLPKGSAKSLRSKTPKSVKS